MDRQCCNKMLYKSKRAYNIATFSTSSEYRDTHQAPRKEWFFKTAKEQRCYKMLAWNYPALTCLQFWNTPKVTTTPSKIVLGGIPLWKCFLKQRATFSSYWSRWLGTSWFLSLFVPTGSCEHRLITLFLTWLYLTCLLRWPSCPFELFISFQVLMLGRLIVRGHWESSCANLHIFFLTSLL